MKLIDNEWVDDNRNSWSAKYFTKEKAQVESDKMNNCFDCDYCFDCAYCTDCTACHHCFECHHCMKCVNEIYKYGEMPIL